MTFFFWPALFFGDDPGAPRTRVNINDTLKDAVPKHSAARNLGRTTQFLVVFQIALGWCCTRRVWPAVSQLATRKLCTNGYDPRKFMAATAQAAHRVTPEPSARARLIREAVEARPNNPSRRFCGRHRLLLCRSG